MYKILLTKKADKDLAKFTPKDATNILEKINQLSYPFSSLLNIKKLSTLPMGYRLRINKIRVIFEVDHNPKTIWIRKIGYRKDIYRFS